MRTVCAYSLSFPSKAAATEIWLDVASWVSNWYRTNVRNFELDSGWEHGTAVPIKAGQDHNLECSVTELDRDGPDPLREMHWRFAAASDRSLLWTIDACVLPSDSTLFTLVLRIASADFELLPARFQFRTPRLIRSLVARGDAHIGVHSIGIDPVRVEPQEVPDLVLLLLEQSRRHPIVVISPDPTIENWPIDPAYLATTLAGLASVHVLTSRWATFALTDELGKQYSCYNGAIRIYWPRFRARQQV